MIANLKIGRAELTISYGASTSLNCRIRVMCEVCGKERARFRHEISVNEINEGSVSVELSSVLGKKAVRLLKRCHGHARICVDEACQQVMWNGITRRFGVADASFHH